MDFTSFCFVLAEFNVYFTVSFTVLSNVLMLIQNIGLLNSLKRMLDGKKSKRAKKIRDKLLWSGCSLVLIGIVSTVFTLLLGKRFIKSIYYLPMENQI